MKIAILLTTILLQIGVGYLLGFKTLDWFRTPPNWEFFILPLGYALGVWLVGVIAAVIQRRFRVSFFVILIGTLLGGVIGLFPLLTGQFLGIRELYYPLMGALIGYYLTKTGINLVL